MDKQKLKYLLKNQFLSFAEDVGRKMAYLRGDEVFEGSYYKQSLSLTVGNDLLSMFVSQQNDVANRSTTDHSFPYSFQRFSGNEKVISDRETTSLSSKERDFQERKKYFASRIAALRGVSLPGDYLRRK